VTDPSPARALIGKLITRPKNFTVVRDQIAAILKSETLGQQALAAAAEEDPRLWTLRVFTERSNPWGVWLDNPPEKRLPNRYFANRQHIHRRKPV
jgi:hypothetical protein